MIRERRIGFSPRKLILRKGGDPYLHRTPRFPKHNMHPGFSTTGATDEPCRSYHKRVSAIVAAMRVIGVIRAVANVTPLRSAPSSNPAHSYVAESLRDSETRNKLAVPATETDSSTNQGSPVPHRIWNTDPSAKSRNSFRGTTSHGPRRRIDRNRLTGQGGESRNSHGSVDRRQGREPGRRGRHHRTILRGVAG